MTKESSEILLDHASCSCLAKESCKRSLENIDSWGMDNYTKALLASMDEDYDGSSVGLIIKGLGFCKEVSGKTAEQHLSRENLRKILDGAFVSNNMSIIDHTMEFVKTIDDPSPFKQTLIKAIEYIKSKSLASIYKK